MGDLDRGAVYHRLMAPRVDELVKAAEDNGLGLLVAVCYPEDDGARWHLTKIPASAEDMKPENNRLALSVSLMQSADPNLNRATKLAVLACDDGSASPLARELMALRTMSDSYHLLEQELAAVKAERDAALERAGQFDLGASSC